MNEDFVHKVNDNNTENIDLKHKITRFKTNSSGSTSISSKKSLVSPSPTEFNDVLFFDILKKPQWLLPVTEADRHFFK